MKLVRIYQCLCDETRLRILNLLSQRPLCVCHLQDILGRSQVQVSQHLARLKGDALVEATRHRNWMIYALPRTISPALKRHLACLQACARAEPLFRKDLAALKRCLGNCGWIDESLSVLSAARSGIRKRGPGVARTKRRGQPA